MRVLLALLFFTLFVFPRPTASEPLDLAAMATAQRGDVPTRSLDRHPRGLMDRDGDRMADSLNAIVSAAAPNELIEVVVTLSQPRRAADIARLAAGPFQVGREFSIINGFSATMTAAQAIALARMPGVHRIEPNFTYVATLDGATADFGSDDARIDFLVDGSGVLLGRRIGICIIDTGIAADHEQLDAGKVVGFFDAVNGLTVPYDDNGHGTHVASIAAGDGIGAGSAPQYRGVAPGAALYGAKVLDSAGFGTDADVIAGIEWCAAQPGVDILSLSLGTLSGSDGQDAGSLAVNCAADPNFSPVCGASFTTPKIVVVAAGNAGPAPATVGSPGAAENAITVAAVANQSGDGRGVYLSAFSSRGPTLDDRIKPDIAAPGMRITAADFVDPTGYSLKSGTSMATPFVSGVVALMLDANPDLRLIEPVSGRLPANRVEDILAATAEDRGPNAPTGEAKDYEYGFGLVDAYGAVAEATGLTPEMYQKTQFPRYLRITGSVTAGGEWFSQPFDVTAGGTPIAATLTIEGVPVCSFGNPILCELFGSGWEWDPDLDMELLDAGTGALVPATGIDITRSECALSGEFCGAGRQETIYYLPLEPGSYQLRVYSFNNAGDFALELSGALLGLVADAGPDQELTDNDNDGLEAVALDGGGSSHSEGIIVSYEWAEGGANIATGVSPIVDFAVGQHIVALTVTDELGDSDTDIVFVEVLANQPPVADAGADLTVADHGGSGAVTVTLDGSLSDDPGGGIITSYQWSLDGAPLGSGAIVTLVLAVGSHDITLTVTDDGGATATDMVTVTVLANQPPVANAGPDQTVTDHDGDGVDLVSLDGTASFDPIGGAITAYQWSENGVAIGNTATLTVPLAIGTHLLTLTVFDAAGMSATDTMTVAVLANQAPVAYAGADVTVSDLDNDGVESVTLDGGGSSDPDGGGIVSYQWSQNSGVVGNGQTIAVSRTIGVHDFTLTVADEAGAVSTDMVTVTINPDPHLSNVVLMARFDGSDGSTTTIDDSNSNHPLTMNGSAQIDAAESVEGGASGLFDDLDATFVSAADSPDWHFGAGEFTVEGWVRFSSLGSYSGLIYQSDITIDEVGWLIDHIPSNQIRFHYSPNGTNAGRVTLAAPWVPALNTWYHIAVDRDANHNLRLYVDGEVMINATVTTPFHDASTSLRIGFRHDGWIDEVRITKDVARYQGAFTQPNKPATFDDVVLLAQFEGTDGSTTTVDASNSNHSLAFNGSAQIDSAESRFGSASALFDDLDASVLTAADSPDWDFGAGEFTVEGWVRFSSLGSYSGLIYHSDITTDEVGWLVDHIPSNQIRFHYSPDGTNAGRVTLAAPWVPTVGTWHHIAVDRDANHNLRLYVDGNVLIQTTVATPFYDASTDLRIGFRHDGWMDEVRITKGAARYAGSFTPPGKLPEFDDVVLLSHLDGPSMAVDESFSNHPLTLNGNAQIDSTMGRFGGASARFDDQGSSSMTALDSADWHFGGEEFTVEGWVRFSVVGSYSGLFYHSDTANDEVSWLVDHIPSNQIRFHYSPDGTNAGRITFATPWTPVVGTWYHIAVDRDAGKRLRLYVDGTVMIETDLPAHLHDADTDMKIGFRHDGWIDELRITKGVAWYGGSFTPPDQPFPDGGGAAIANIGMVTAVR